MTLSTDPLDPVRYEVFAHRLWAIGEEGRIALQRVSASPIVVQGGECMSSFYDPAGTMVLACSGHLRFAAATSDAIKRLIEWYGDSPGFHEGDQVFFNDPYVAGSHTYDQMIVMPIFSQGRLVAWTAASTHTADVGGSLVGEPTEIFHEGIRILGLKVIEGGEFREDVFRTITEQCRDPRYVGLDLKSRIAANHVCRRGFLALVDKLGLEFVLAACQRLIRDSEEQARARLRSLPDGTWRSRVYFSTRGSRRDEAEVHQVCLAMTKTADRLSFDFTGTSPQVPNDFNSTLPSTMAHVSLALTNHLFWDIPWSDGKLRPVSVHVPEGSLLNCRFPAACSRAPHVGGYLVSAVGETVAKMLYAGGRRDDVNAGWYAFWHGGGPGYFYGGHNREGLPTAQGLFDIHGGGLGAAATRDGVNSGGHMNIPSGGISDIERQEMQYPFVYFTRRHVADGAGFGQFRGGLGTERLFMIYGSNDASTNFQPYGGIPQGAVGLFGGYGAGYGGTRALFTTRRLQQRLAAGDFPTSPAEVVVDGWGEVLVPPVAARRVPLPAFSLVADFTQSGGGFGDPLLRDPEAVVHELRLGLTGPRTALEVYGVVVAADGTVDGEGTRAQRQQARADRMRRGRKGARGLGPSSEATHASILRFHAYLELVSDGQRLFVRCTECGQLLCRAEENYKAHAVEIERDLEEFAGGRLPSGEPYAGIFLEYACPGCGTLLQVDLYCPALGGERPLWDIQLDTASLIGGSSGGEQV